MSTQIKNLQQGDIFTLNNGSQIVAVNRDNVTNTTFRVGHEVGMNTEFTVVEKHTESVRVAFKDNDGAEHNLRIRESANAILFVNARKPESASLF